MSNTPDLTTPQWVASSYSGNGGMNCVQWAPSVAVGGSVPVRDSKVTDGPTLTFGAGAWSAFVGMAKNAAV